MTFLRFLQDSRDNKKIIDVLDSLLQIAIDGDAINKSRKIDMGLYKILNSPKVNQEVIHMGVYPIIGENKRASKDFVSFVNNLWMYMGYDIWTDSLWAKTVDNPGAQKNIYNKVVSVRKEILRYLLDKKLISMELYDSESNYNVKGLLD